MDVYGQDISYAKLIEDQDIQMWEAVVTVQQQNPLPSVQRLLQV